MEGKTIPNYDYRCQECGLLEIRFSSYEDRDKLRHCAICATDSMTREYLSMPGITKASYIDSSKTARAKEFSDLKQVAKLEVEKANVMRPEDRVGINKEIKKLKELKK